MEIKKLTKENLEEAMNIVYNTSIEYDTSEILKEENGKKIFEEMFTESFFEMELFGMFYEDKMLGVIGLEDNNYIAILYVLKEFQKQGIGTELLEFAKKYVENKTEKLDICADKKAVDFYLKNGFKRYYKSDESKVSMYFDVKENNYGTKKI